MRSKLFVPGSRPDLFAKALAGDADALSFDLEDSVPAGGKDEARRLVADCVRGDAARASGKVLIVRTNAPEAAQFDADLEALSGSGIDLVNVPKLESADAVRAVAARLAQTGAGQAPPRLLVNIETPRALRDAAALACADPCVAGLQLGLADLFEPAGIDRDDVANVHAAMFAVRMAAAEAGVFALDGAFAAIDAPERYEAEARMARGLGFAGKSCIHPRQVALANRVFAPTAAELAWARRVVDAASDAEAAGQGAFALDGRMVDAPFVTRARRLLQAAASQGAAA